MRLYEGMFLVKTSAAQENYEGLKQELAEVIGRGDGKVVDITKWAERRLAYEIGGNRKAAYILVHFNAPPDSVVKIERYARISPSVLRVLITLDEDGVEVRQLDVEPARPPAAIVPPAIVPPAAATPAATTPATAPSAGPL